MGEQRWSVRIGHNAINRSARGKPLTSTGTNLSPKSSTTRYVNVMEGIELGYLCQKDGKPCEFETRHFKTGEL